MWTRTARTSSTQTIELTVFHASDFHAQGIKIDRQLLVANSLDYLDKNSTAFILLEKLRLPLDWYLYSYFLNNFSWSTPKAVNRLRAGAQNWILNSWLVLPASGGAVAPVPFWDASELVREPDHRRIPVVSSFGLVPFISAAVKPWNDVVMIPIWCWSSGQVPLPAWFFRCLFQMSQLFLQSPAFGCFFA